MRSVLITGATINTGVAIVEKFASEGYNVIFTGRNSEKVHAKENEYRKKFPSITVIGYHIDSLIDERTVDEESVNKMFADIDSRGLFVETLVLNAADQGLGQKVFENPLTDFTVAKVLSTFPATLTAININTATKTKKPKPKPSLNKDIPRKE